jgi:hypothetical protein
MKKLKEVLTSNKAKAFGWQIANGIIALIILYCSDLNWAYAPVLIAGLNTLTKYINQKYL